jgi:hypothetical protein
MVTSSLRVQDLPFEVILNSPSGRTGSIRLPISPVNHERNGCPAPEVLLTFEEGRKQLFIKMAPAAQQWFPHRKDKSPIVGLRPEAQNALSYVLDTCSKSCATIDWHDCYVDDLVVCLPQLPRTLKRLKIRNGGRLFFEQPGSEEGTPRPSLGPATILYRFQHLEVLELINCSHLAADVRRLRMCLPGFEILERNYGLPKTLSGIEARWKAQQTPELAVELASRYILLGNAKWKDVVKRSLTATIRYYLHQDTTESALRVLPWAVWAVVYGESGLVREAESYLEQAPEEYHLPERFSQCVQCSRKLIWEITTHLTFSTRAEISDILDRLERYHQLEGNIIEN